MITEHFGTLQYLRAENIQAKHCFTTRLGGVSQGDTAGLNIGANRGDPMENIQTNYGLLGQALGFTPNCLVLARQTHSDIVRAVDATDFRGLNSADYPECDALITATHGIGLVVFTADCTPVLLHDPVTGAVGAVHAGWKGTAADICGKAVQAMVAHYGCKPENIRAAIGPNIATCCFETDRDVPEALEKTYGAALREHVFPKGEKYYVNLKAVNALALRRAGVTQIEISDHCTACNLRMYWSHRKMGDRRGSQGAIIICQEVSP